MKPKAALFMPDHISSTVISEETLGQLGQEVQLVDAAFSKWDSIESLPALAEVEYLFTGWHSPVIDAHVVSACPNLKAVFHCAGSVNSVTSEAFWKTQIPITSAFHANSIPVAEFTYAQIVLSLKAYWQSFSEYKTTREIPFDRKDVVGTKNATIGLISFGSIARLLLEKLRALDIDVITYDPYVDEETAKQYGVEKVELDELFKRSNVVSCHAPLTDQTINLVKTAHITSMPHKATFINTARGKIVDQPGLVDALKERPDLVALLDVTDPEPLSGDDPIFDLPNAFVSAHIAGSVGNECFNLGEAMLHEFKRFVAGEPLKWEIKQERAVLMT